MARAKTFSISESRAQICKTIADSGAAFTKYLIALLLFKEDEVEEVDKKSVDT